MAKGLQAFLAFDSDDASVRDRSRWRAALDGPLPQEGVGLDGVIEELLEWVVPYGLRTPHPGFSGGRRAPSVPCGAHLRKSEVHHTVHRACAVLGLGRRSFTATETDRTGRVDPAALRERIRTDRRQGLLPLAMVAVAGTTGTGSVDDFPAMVDIAAAEGVLLHVDGAYGLPARCLPELEAMFEGVEHADSVIVDPHKWLGTPVGCGATYVPDGTLLERAFTQEPAAYLTTFAPEDLTSQFDHFGTTWFDRSLELHAPSRGSWVWAVLLEISAEGVRARIRRHIAFADRLASLVDDALGSSWSYRRRCRSAASATGAR